jgi:photosystem II stability/assembly factor-like uncharacterized protein
MVGIPKLDVNSIVVDPKKPTTLYAAFSTQQPYKGTVYLGVYKSTNGGASWTTVNNGFENLAVSLLAIESETPSTLYAAGEKMYKSSNGGLSWKTIMIGLPDDPRFWIIAMAVDPMTPSTLYVTSKFYGVYKSTDGGENWYCVNDDLESAFFLSIDRYLPTTIYAATDGYGIYKSTDGGIYWRAVNNGLPKDLYMRSVLVDPTNPSIIYAGTNMEGVFMSTDGGMNWAWIGLPGSEVNVLVIDPSIPNLLYAGTSNSVNSLQLMQ